MSGDFAKVKVSGAVDYDLIGGSYLMNLPNKLTVLRVLMVPLFCAVYADRSWWSGEQMDRTGDFCGGQSDRSAGWKNCQKI